jgi:uncharacterized protein YbjT (DUF2867 family)
VLVLGATGAVGSAVLERLVRRGVTVRGVSRDPEAAAAAAANAGRRGSDVVEWARFDLESPRTFGPALEGVERVFLVARPGDDDADRPVPALLDALHAAGATRVVDLSAMGAEAREDFSLRRVELLLERSGLAWTHLRPNFFMQIFSGGALLAGIRATGEIRLPTADARLSFIDAGDIADVAAATLTQPGHEGKAYTLTGGEALDHEVVAREIARASGRAVRYRAIDEDAARVALAASGLGPARVERLIGFYRLVRAGACAPVSPDVQAVLGRAPNSFAEFAREHAGLWRAGAQEAAPPA